MKITKLIAIGTLCLLTSGYSLAHGRYQHDKFWYQRVERPMVIVVEPRPPLVQPIYYEPNYRRAIYFVEPRHRRHHHREYR